MGMSKVTKLRVTEWSLHIIADGEVDLYSGFKAQSLSNLLHGLIIHNEEDPVEQWSCTITVYSTGLPKLVCLSSDRDGDLDWLHALMHNPRGRFKNGHR